MICNIDYYTNKTCNPAWSLDDASIPYYNLTFILSGEAYYTVNDENLTCVAGDCLFIYPGASRKATTNPENPMHCVSFNILDIPWPIKLPTVTRFGKNSKIIFYIREFETAWKQPPPKNRIVLSALLSLILNELTSINELQSKTNLIIDSAERFIKQNINKPISSEDVAKSVNLTSTYLGSLFRKHTGETITNYINRHKMLYAATLLSNPKNTITDAAFRAGFSDIYYFSKVFKKTFGLSPSDYRKHEFPITNDILYTHIHADSVTHFATIDFPPANGCNKFTFDLVASDYIDGVVALCPADFHVGNWTDFSIAIQLQPDGLLYAINANGYNAYQPIPYKPGLCYKIEIHADIEHAQYDAFVYDPDGVKLQLAKNFIFRTTANRSTNLGKLCVRSGHNCKAKIFYIENFCSLH